MNVNISKTSQEIAINKSNCPICQKANQCQVEKGKDCWCAQEKIPNELIETLPKDKQGKSCLCLTCVQRFKVAQALSVDISDTQATDK